VSLDRLSLRSTTIVRSWYELREGIPLWHALPNRQRAAVPSSCDERAFSNGSVIGPDPARWIGPLMRHIGVDYRVSLLRAAAFHGC